ncbi:MAG: hypothetical protein ACLGJB_18675 [Blastocatellia bacterium]
MLDLMLAQDVFSSAQFDRLLKSLDEWVQIYTEAALTLFVLVLGLITWAVFYETVQEKVRGKKPSRRQPLSERHLLQTEP